MLSRRCVQRPGTFHVSPSRTVVRSGALRWAFGSSGMTGGKRMGEQALPRRWRRRRAANVPGGRPVKHEVKVAVEEEAQLIVLAQQAGMTIPRLLVSSALSRRDAGTITRAERRELLVELLAVKRLVGNIALNVNQVAKAVNTTGDLPPQTGQLWRSAHRAIDRIDDLAERFSLGKPRR